MGQFKAIDKAIDDFRQGKMLVVVDDEERENVGCMPSHSTPSGP